MWGFVCALIVVFVEGHYFFEHYLSSKANADPIDVEPTLGDNDGREKEGMFSRYKG